MVTIIYPFKDYTAADIAMKLQALASIQEQPLYVVPKHFGRNETKVQKKLDKTKVALLIVFDSESIDEQTSNEIDFLTREKIPVYAFIPDKLDVKHPEITTYKYKANNKTELLNKLSAFLKDIKKQPQTKNTEWADLLIAIGTITGGLLLLNALLKKD